MVVRIMIIAAVAIYVVYLVRTVIDLFRRDDLTTSAKAAWILLLLIIPFITLMIYLMVRPPRAAGQR